MKKILSVFSVLLLAGSLWAADVTVTESFQTCPYTSGQTKRVSYTGDNYVMWVRGVRYGGSSDNLIDGTKGFWMSRGTSSSCYVETENNAIGGIKAVSFNWRQFGTEAANTQLVINVKAGSSTKTISVAAGDTYKTADQSFSNSFNVKQNAKLTIQNASYTGSESTVATSGGRIILGPITITPYLYYGTRVATIGLQQKGYKNTSLINNTGTTPTFSSSEETVATVETDGTIVPKAAGQTTITASWEQVTVTYVLNVVDNILVENFSLVNQSKLATTATSWTGDVCSWTVDSVRKAINDTTCNNPRIQGVYAPIHAYLTTTNAFEGGIKHLYFKWQQWGSEKDKVLKLKVKAGTYDNTVSVAGVASGQQQEQTFDADLEIASAQQLIIKNVSELTAGGAATSNARLVISDMRITPYLLYTVKEADAYMKDGAFTNTALIKNTTGAAVEYTLEDNDGEATIDGATGAVTVLTNGQVTVKATWGQVSTTYTLNLHAQSEPEMSFANAEVRTVLSGSVANTLSKATDATPTYKSSNTAVAEVDANGAITIKNVGQTTITASCAATESYKAGSASYELIVRAGGNTLKETFGKVDKDGNATGAAGLKEIDWNGDLFTWQATGNARRKPNSDTIYNTTTQGTFIGVNAADNGGAGILRSKEAVEGGIKYISFFWKQWATENDGRTLRLNIYAGEDSVTCVEHVAIKDNPKNVYWYYAAGNVMKANKQLIIKNASRLANGELVTSNARVIVDTIEITPYLLYTLKIDTLDISESTTYTNTHLIDNRDNANAIEYSILEGPATINGDVVTATATGNVKVQAKWDNVTTTYTLVVKNSSQYNLTWNADGGTLEGGTTAGLVTTGTALEAPTATKTGYNHTGWDPEVPATMPANDFTSTAQYEAKKCTITLKCNYTDGPEDIEFVATYGETSPVAGQTLFTRPGYSINRGYWKDPETEGTGERLVNSTGKFTTGVSGYTDDQQKWIRDAEEDITLYAHWKLDTFKITYANMEGATNFENAPKKYTYETSTITLGTPTKTGYTFAGWKANNAEGAAVTEITQGSLGDTTLYATWTAKKCTITLKCNYTDGPKDVVFEATYGEESPLTTADVHTRENYTMYRGYWMDPVTEGKGTRLVNPTGKFTTDVSGYTIGQNWAYDAEEDITLYAHWTLSTLEIKEEADNAALLNQYDGKTMDVKLTRSALVANVWNSLCLPFAIAKSDLGENAQVVEMTGAEMQGDVINVTFAEFNSNTLVAGTPYLVKPAAAVEFSTFTDKTIDATPKTIGDNGLIELVGIYSPFAMTANDKTKLFLAQPDGQGNNLFFASVSGNLKGMRAYFNLLPQTSGAPIRLGRMVIQEPTTPTEIENVNENVNANQKMIIDGKLVIVREGVCYDVNGQIVK